MKKCLYCFEDIQNEAIKCKHCGEWLNDSDSFNKNKLQKRTISEPDFSNGKLYSPPISPSNEIVNTEVQNFQLSENGESEDKNQIEAQQLQNKINLMLRWGIVFSLVWLAGLGSLIGFILGIKSKNIIEASNRKINGMGRALFCIIVGGIGMAFWFIVIYNGIINRAMI